MISERFNETKGGILVKHDETSRSLEHHDPELSNDVKVLTPSMNDSA